MAKSDSDRHADLMYELAVRSRMRVSDFFLNFMVWIQNNADRVIADLNESQAVKKRLLSR